MPIVGRLVGHRSMEGEWHERKLQRLVGFVVVCGWLGSTGTVRADAVTDWHAIAVHALGTMAPSRSILVTFLDIAIVQAAVHDAVQAIDRRFKPYQASMPGATGSPAAAAQQRRMMSWSPSFQTRPPRWTRRTRSTRPPTSSRRRTWRACRPGGGRRCARPAGQRWRLPNPVPAPFVGGPAPGQWRPTPSLQPPPPPTEAPMAMPWLGAVPPFTLKSGDQFRAHRCRP